MGTLCNHRYTGSWSKKNRQIWHNCGKVQVGVPVYSRIFEQIFFSVIKKNWWHTWPPPFLSYYRWYKPIIVCQRPWHSLEQAVLLTNMLNKLGFTTSISKCTRRARPFLFFKKLFCPNIPLIV